MTYIKNSDWTRWQKRAKNLLHELTAISKGIDAEDIKQNREIAELAHLSGATKYLIFTVRELQGGKLATSSTEEKGDK